MATKKAGTAKKVPIHNPFRTAVLSGAKRSVTDLYKPKGIRNPIAPMNKSTVMALTDDSYKRGLLAGRRSSAKRKKHSNPIGVDDAIDLLKVGLLGAGTKIGVDLAAGQILGKLNISKATNKTVYYLAKMIGAVVAGEVLSDATKGASYTGAGGALASYMAEYGEDMLAGKLPSAMPLGALPTMRIVQPPAVAPQQLRLAGSGGGGGRALGNIPTVRPRGMSV